MLKEKEIINSKIGVIAHDSGGAYYIKSFLEHHKIDAFYYLKGPSISIFNEIKSTKKCNTLDEIIAKSDILIFGTGWETEFEIKSLMHAKKKKIKTISFLDHWTNYRQRFIINKKIILPDLIVVFDIYAENIARETFPKSQKILKTDNYYIQNLTANSVKIKSSENYILFIDEPIAKHQKKEHKTNFTESDALNYFLNYIRDTKFKNEKVLIRMHPSRKNLNKYDLIVNNEGNVFISKGRSLVFDILKSKFVVGIESMAMVVALKLNKNVYSIIPSKSYQSQLPHKQITNFYDKF